MVAAVMARGEMSVGQRIQWARKRVGLSQERLAQAIGTTRQVVIRWEKDRHLPNEGSRQRLAEATGQDASFFSDERESEDDEEADIVSLDEFLQRRVDALVKQALAATADA